VPKIADFRDRELDAGTARAVHGVAQVHEPLAFAMRQRLEQHGANDAEDGGVGADA
jgi:hypothetical protein